MKKSMLILVSVLSLAACKKHHDSAAPAAGTYVKATIDGKPMTFNMNVFAHKNNDNSIAISGQTSLDVKNTEIFTLSMFDNPSSIKAQTYTLDAGPGTMVIIYGTIANSVQSNFTASTNSASAADVFTVTITSIDNQTVQGSFSGTVVQQNGMTTTATRTVTDGTFSAPIK